MKKILSFAILIIALLFVTGCEYLSDFMNGGNDNPGGSETQDFDSLDTIYQLAVKSGYTGSYDSWIQSLKGDAIELRVNGTMIQWHYSLSNDWFDLIDKGELMGAAGKNGLTPEIGPNGHWFIGGVDSLIPATGVQGEAGQDGHDGKDGQDGQDGAPGKDGQDGLTPYVGENNNWWIGSTDTGISAYGIGEKGETGEAGQDGKDGVDGKDGEDGTDGLTPYIGENGNWWIGETDTEVPVTGSAGDSGKSVYELYIEAHPEYTGTEEEWLDDYINHRLEGELTYYTVRFVNGENVTEQSVLSGRLLQKPENPVKSGHIFIGWYNGDIKWNFELNSVHNDMTLTATFVTSSEYSDMYFDSVSANYSTINYSIHRDTLSTLDSVALYEGGSLVQTNTNEDVTSFEDVKSNTEYRLVLSYSYDLNDGMGIQTGTNETYVTTRRYTTPTFTLSNYNVNGTTISYSYRENDPQDRGSLTKVSLYIDNDLVDEIQSPENTTIENVLSNKTYKVVLTYTYDLNDGNGEQTIEREFTITTPAKAAPSVSLALDNITQNELKGSVAFLDTDSTGTFTKVELYQGENKISESLEKSFDFTELTPAGLYTFKISYSYDLNDGNGVHEEVVELVKRTHGVYEILSTGIINSSAIMEGDTIYLRIVVDNPSNANFTKAIINGKEYVPTNASTNTTLFFNVPATTSGNMEIVVEELVATLDGVDYEYVTYNDNTFTAPVYGKLQVTGAEFYVLKDPEQEFSEDNLERRYYKLYNEELYAKLLLDNPANYSLTSASMSFASSSSYSYSAEDIIMSEDNSAAYIKIYNTKRVVNCYNLQIYNIIYQNDFIEKKITYSQYIPSSIVCLDNYDTVEISTKEELISVLANNASYRYYKLMNDIDLSGSEWTPLERMNGVFNGNGHSITGMTIVSNFEDNHIYLGLFKGASGLFLNVNMKSVLIMSKLTGSSQYESYVGSIVAYARYSSPTINFVNCSVDSNSLISFTNKTGGCSFVGGLCGAIGNYASGTILNCSNESNIVCNSDEYAYNGGLFGYLQVNEGYNFKIINCYNSGNITNGNIYSVFGSIQCDSKSTFAMYNCYNTGSVNGNYNCYLLYGDSKVYNSISIGKKYPNEVLPMEDVTYTFETNGGSQIDSITGTIITLPTPTKEGYLFYGWYENEDLSGDKIDSLYYSKENCTLYAKYYKIVSVDEISSCISIEGYRQYLHIGNDTITVDIPEDIQSDYYYVYAYIRPVETMIFSFNIQVLFERGSYGDINYYKFIGDYNYESCSLGDNFDYTFTLNPNDYIRIYVRPQNYGHAMISLKDIVIAIDAE